MSNKVHERLNKNFNKDNYNKTNCYKTTYYNSISKSYEELHKDEQLKKIQLIKQLIHIKPNSKILDLGCGPYFSEWNVSFDGKSIAGLNITGLDSSKELLNLAANKGIKTVLGKAESLPFPNEYFDYVFSITAIQNFDDVEKAIKEIKRVIKKSGKIVITFLKRSAKKEAIINLIRKHFNIAQIIEEEKDVILFIII